MVLGVRGHDVPAVDAEDLGTSLKELGVSNIQLVAHKSFPDFLYSQESIEHLAQTFRESGVHVAVYGCYIDPMDPAGQQRFLEHIEYAGILGADMIATESGVRLAEESAKGEHYQSFVKVFQEFADKAKDLGVRVALETVGVHPIDTPELTKKLLEDVGRDNFCTVLDPENLRMKPHTQDPAQIAVRLYGDKVAAVHWKQACPLLDDPILQWAAKQNLTLITEGLQGKALQKTLEAFRKLQSS